MALMMVCPECGGHDQPCGTCGGTRYVEPLFCKFCTGGIVQETGEKCEKCFGTGVAAYGPSNKRQTSLTPTT